MALATSYPPVPGTWVVRAQDALDQLSSLHTVDDVVQHIGGARALTDAVLGAPSAGGSATRRAVRATGALLQHRLGPALAAEALSWAASVAEAVDRSTVEAFLEAAAQAEASHRPLRVEDRFTLLAHLEGCVNEAARRRKLFKLWSALPGAVAKRPSVPNDEDYWTPTSPNSCWPVVCDGDITELVARLLAGEQSNGAEAAPARPTIVEVLCAPTEETQVEAFGRLSVYQVREMASSELLFDLAEPIIARCLLDHTDLVLLNPAAPEGLRDRVRRPYDEATLELALRAGPRHYEVARVERMLSGLSASDRMRLLREIPEGYLQGLRACGLNHAPELLHGHLAAVDLSSRALAECVLGTADHWHWRRLPENVVEVLIHHPQAASLTWTLAGRSSGNVQPELAARLVREACPEIAAIALRYLPLEALDQRDGGLARLAGSYWVARCPGIPAMERPARCVPPVDEKWWEVEGWSVAFEGPFNYPEVIEALQGPYSQAPRWTITLPDGPADVERNAKAMRNCTRSFTAAIRAGRGFLLIVHDPSGLRYNVAVIRDCAHYWVGEINNWNNEGIEPAWLRPAITDRLATRSRTFEPPEPPLARPRHDRRNRRRSRA